MANLAASTSHSSASTASSAAASAATAGASGARKGASYLCSRGANLMSYTMASSLCSQIKLSKAFVRRRGHESGQINIPTSVQWDLSQSEDDTSIIAGTNVVEPIDTEEAPEIPIFQSDQDVVEVIKDPSVLRTSFKFPVWSLGPSILLVTGIVPTLWLPLSSVFLGPNIAGLLSLVGLDCIFNMGPMLFFLMADAFGRPEKNMFDLKHQVSISYRVWNLAASTLGFVAHLALFFASHRGILQPHHSFHLQCYFCHNSYSYQYRC